MTSRLTPPPDWDPARGELHRCPSCKEEGCSFPHGPLRHVQCGCGHDWNDYEVTVKAEVERIRVCKNCINWEKFADREDGVCHRWPPVCIVDRGQILQSCFPSTYATTWCGEFSAT